MMKRNNVRKEMRNKTNKKVIRLGDCIIRVREVHEHYSVFELRGRECGFKTYLKIYRSDFAELGRAIMESATIAPTVVCRIDGVHVKHREYTQHMDEAESTFKFYESRHAYIEVHSAGGHCLVALADHDTGKIYRTVSFETHRYLDDIKRFRSTINNMYFENRSTFA